MHALQEYLFRRIREKLPPTDSLADIIAGYLHVSNDSAYRRIRGETPMILEEAKILCDAFGISLDEVIGVHTNTVAFTLVNLDNNDYSFSKYLNGILHDLKLLGSIDDKRIVYMAKDLPIFHHFCYRPLFSFRYFFWMKSILQHPDFVAARFSMNCLSPDIEKLGKNILEVYNSIPSVEIWNTECVNSTIAQVEYYREAGYFETESEIDEIYQALRQTISHVCVQAENGRKFMPGENPSLKRNNFEFYYNRLVLGDNTIMAIAGGKKTLYLNYDILNYMSTQDEKLCDAVHLKLQNMMRRATILSNVSEKQRNKFFSHLDRKIPASVNATLKK